MDREAVIEFLGQVPLLQRLPASSLKRIADLVQVKHYNPGEYVVREGSAGEGLYFIWEGLAEVSESVNAEEGNRPELQLRQYDYFGYGTGGIVHQVNVIALSKLTCLVLQHGNSNLLQPRSIWNADETENFSTVEHILRMEPLEVDIFRGITLPNAPSFGQVFGGQSIGQALAAASKTVDCLKLVHSLHVYFIVAGDINSPIIYQVRRVRDGNSFATRRVDAKQHGLVIFTLLASFQREESGFEHQVALMPEVPAPEMLPSMEELRERRLTDPRLPMAYRNTVARENFVPWPIEIKFCESNSSSRQSRPSLSYWFKARGKLSDDPALHRCVVAYASDLIFSGVSLNPHRKKGLKTASLSLDHSLKTAAEANIYGDPEAADIVFTCGADIDVVGINITTQVKFTDDLSDLRSSKAKHSKFVSDVMWFHRPVKADDWLLYVIDSPLAHSGRGFVTGRMFDKKGELIVSLTQEALIRKKNQPPKPKL